MPAPMQNATTSVTATPLWDLATGARHLLICDAGHDARAGSLTALLATLNGLPDVTVWADHRALTSVKLPDDLSYGYRAAGSRNAAEMLGLAVELADARLISQQGHGRWLHQPKRTSRLVLVVADLTKPGSGQPGRGRLALERLLESGGRTAMPVVALTDPATTPADLIRRLSRACASWEPELPAAAASEARELAGALS